MEQVKFKKGKHFEEKIVQALITDHQFAEQMLEVLNVDYFNVGYLKELTQAVFDYYDKYRAFPTFKTLVLVVKDEVDNELLRNQVIQYLIKIKKDPLNGDSEYIKEESLDFCKKRSLALAMEESLGHIESKNFEQIVPVIQKALLAGSERDVGHVFAEEGSFKERMTSVFRNPIPTPWPEINDLTQGGFAPGELWCGAGPTGAGKSHWLVDIGKHAAEIGYNVVHYTFELSDLIVGKRYDARFSGVSINNLNAEEQRVWDSLQDVKGSIIIKYYPCKAASALTLKSHIHKLTMKDQKPDLVLVDYGDLMRSGKNHDHKRFEEEAIYEELRNMAGELQLPVVTVTQTNRSSLDEEVITLKHVAECFQKAMLSDVFVTIMRRKQNTVETPGNFYLAKNRLGPDGIKLNTMANTSISKFRIISKDEEEEVEDSTRQRIQSAINELNENL